MEKSCLLKGTIISLVYHLVCLFAFLPPFVSWWRSGGYEKTALLYLLSHDHQIRVVLFLLGKYIRLSFSHNLKESSGSGNNVGGRRLKVTCEYSPHSSQSRHQRFKPHGQRYSHTAM